MQYALLFVHCSTINFAFNGNFFYVSALLAIIAAILFASQTDDKTRGFVIVRADGFYMQVRMNIHNSSDIFLFQFISYLQKKISFQLGAIVLNFSVFVSSVYEGIYARRGGDPTKLKEYTETPGTTINNPGYREHHPRNGKHSVQYQIHL